MRLRTLAGAYAGQIRDYSTPVGLAALQSGTAERLEEMASPAVVAAIDRASPLDRAAVNGSGGKRKKK